MNNKYQRFDTDRINAIPITAVASQLGDKLKRVGSIYKTRCLWHDDHDPSLVLYERTGENHCYCFVCNEKHNVIDYAMKHENWTFKETCQWLSSTFGISTIQAGEPVHHPKQRPTDEPMKPVEPTYTYIPMEMVDELVSAENSLCRCLMRMFHPEAVIQLCEEYRIGCYSINGQEDYTVFPSIDVQGRVCNLKVQHYDTNLKSPCFSHNNDKIYWLGTIWKSEGRLPNDAEFRSSCLFGEHLLQRYPNNIVALVESPKNALFGALAYPEMVWVATGNKGNLKQETLMALQGRDVIIVPDCDAHDEWTKEIEKMEDIANFDISDFCKRSAPEGQPKFDIADYIQQQYLQQIKF